MPGVLLWVSLEPQTNTVICLLGPSFWNGDAGV